MGTLHMLRLNINAAAVLEHGLHAGLDTPDWGYLLHVFLTDLFGTKAPRPFHIDARNVSADRICVLGYVTEDPETLRTDAQLFANPIVWSGVDWTSKPMPVQFQAGQRFGFSVRVCPVIRRHNEESRTIELDAFRSHRHLSRDGAYREWIRNRIAGATVLRSDLRYFQVNTLLRRTQAETVAERKNQKLRRPDAVIEGTLEVTDPERFHTTLVQGVGRHRGFGFGMVLLRRPI